MKIGSWVLLGLERFTSFESTTRCSHSEKATRPEGLEVCVSVLVGELSFILGLVKDVVMLCAEKGEAMTHFWIKMLHQVNSYLHDRSKVLKLSCPLPPWSCLPGYTMCHWA